MAAGGVVRAAGSARKRLRPAKFPGCLRWHAACPANLRATCPRKGISLSPGERQSHRKGAPMKRLLAALALLGGCLVFGISAADTGTPSNVDHRSGYFHLLLLDQREAMEHVKALHEYADHHGDALDPLVLCRHVDDLGRNIQGMQDDLVMIEKAPGTSVASWTNKIHGQQVE